MRYSLFFCILIFVACSTPDPGEIKGQWVSADNESILSISEDSIHVDSQCPMEYKVQGKALVTQLEIVKWATREVPFELEEDTLLLKVTDEIEQKYIRSNQRTQLDHQAQELGITINLPLLESTAFVRLEKAVQTADIHIGQNRKGLNTMFFNGERTLVSELPAKLKNLSETSNSGEISCRLFIDKSLSLVNYRMIMSAMNPERILNIQLLHAVHNEPERDPCDRSWITYSFLLLPPPQHFQPFAEENLSQKFVNLTLDRKGTITFNGLRIMDGDMTELIKKSYSSAPDSVVFKIQNNGRLTYANYLRIVSSINEMIDTFRAEYGLKEYGGTIDEAQSQEIKERFPKRIVVENTE